MCQAIIGGLIITLSAQLGDLSESLIKRDAGVKDSSNILPGHGGFLDRVDGYIFAAPIAYYYFKFFVLNVAPQVQPIIDLANLKALIGA